VTKSIHLIVADPDANNVTITAMSSDNAILPYTNIVLCDSGSNTCMLTTTAMKSSDILIEITSTTTYGMITITIQAIDSTGLTSSYALPLRVNSAPTITGLEDLSIITNASDSIAFSISDNETSDLVLTKESSDLSLVSLENIVISGTGASRTLSITPTANQSVTVSITISVIDGDIRVLETFDINVLHLFTVNESISLSGVFRSAVAFGDIDNDGDLDLLLTGNIAISNKITKLYRNIDGNFIEDTGISLTAVMYGAVAFGDYDNDGDLDILLIGYTGIDAIAKIYQNINGSFVEDTSIDLPGVNFSAAAFGDYDNDGDLDILLCGQDISNNKISKLFQNNNGNFVEDRTNTLSGVGNYASAAFGDYDNDGHLDILLTGQDSNSVRQSKLYKNSGGYYTEDTASSLTGVDYSSASFGDYDNDGDLDILLSGNTGSTRIAVIYDNSGGVFSANNNITLPAVDTGSATFGDYDNDGDLDILITGTTGAEKIANLYENTGSDFTLNTEITLEKCFTGQSLFGDYDNDGDLDILLTGADSSNNKIAQIYRNNINTSNTPPSDPTGLSAVVQGENVLLSWSAASDAQTISETGLNYNLSIGSGPGMSDILAPMALPLSNGYRLLVGRGAIQQLTTTVTINTAGTYYWRVQAIDTSFSGSLFSSEYSFTVTDVAPDPGNNLPVTHAISLWVIDFA
jgi:predicted nucleotidyltransferase